MIWTEPAVVSFFRSMCTCTRNFVKVLPMREGIFTIQFNYFLRLYTDMYRPYTWVRKEVWIYICRVYPLIDLVCPTPPPAPNACRQPYVLTFIQFLYTSLGIPKFRAQTRSQPNATRYLSTLYRTPTDFFPSGGAPNWSQNLYIRKTYHKKVFFPFFWKNSFVLPQLPPPARTSLLPSSTLIPLQFLSFLPNFSLHLLSH